MLIKLLIIIPFYIEINVCVQEPQALQRIQILLCNDGELFGEHSHVCHTAWTEKSTQLEIAI